MAKTLLDAGADLSREALRMDGQATGAKKSWSTALQATAQQNSQHRYQYANRYEIVKMLLARGGIRQLAFFRDWRFELCEEEMVEFLRPKVHWSRFCVKFWAERLLYWWSSKAWAPGKGVERELKTTWESAVSSASVSALQPQKKAKS